MSELISVIIPIFKVEAFLDECVTSVLRQTYSDIEIVLVDDGTPDKCAAISDSYALRNPNVVVIHKSNGGLSDARNKGIDAAFGEEIVFIDSDDYVHEKYIETLVRNKTKNHADLSICDFQNVDEHGNMLENDSFLDTKVVSEKEELFTLLYQNWRMVPAWNKLYEKKQFSTLRFEFGKFHEDEFIIHQVLGQCRTVTISGDRLYYYRNRLNSISNSKSEINLLDTLEMEIERYEYCALHGFPVRSEITQSYYLDYVISLKQRITDSCRKRYRKLLQRYRGLYFSQKKNRGINNLLRAYCNKQYLMINSIITKRSGKR